MFMGNIFKFRKDIYINNNLLIKNFDLNIKDYRSIIVLGSSGSGKTTVLKSIRRSFRLDNLVKVYISNTIRESEFTYDKSDDLVRKFLRKKDNYLTRINLIYLAINRPKYLFLDDLSGVLSNSDIQLYFAILKKYNITYVYFTCKTDLLFLFDYAYVIYLKCIAMEGTPRSFLKKESLFNKFGFDYPFYPALSKKLMLYNVINEICFDEEELEESLWPKE